MEQPTLSSKEWVKGEMPSTAALYHYQVVL